MNLTQIHKEKCSCGFDKSNPHIQHQSDYSSFGWILYWIGISAKPIKVDFKCQICGDILQSTTDPEILKKYVGR